MTSITNDSEAVDLLTQTCFFCKECGYKYVDGDHILYYMLKHTAVLEFCTNNKVNLESINEYLLKYIDACSVKKSPSDTSPVSYTQAALGYMEHAGTLSKKLNNSTISPIAYILVFLIYNTGEGQQILSSHGFTKQKIYKNFPAFRSSQNHIPAPSKSTVRQPVLKFENPVKEAKQVVDKVSDKLRNNIFGQDHVITEVTNSLKISMLGLNNIDKPLVSLLFLGPTGTGKTETAKQIAAALDYKLLRYDMSEYAYGHMVAKLIGSPFGYYNSEQGGYLTKAVIEHPKCVVLLDEIEKAHHDVHNLLLQILDYGVLTDGKGNEADFKKSVIIMTSNLGVKELESHNIGFLDTMSVKDSIKAVNDFFSPEFRNRIDKILTFNRLNKDNLSKIVDNYLSEINHKLESRNIELVLSNKAIKHLIDNGYNPLMGARPLHRVFQSEIMLQVAELIMEGCNNAKVEVTYDKNGVKLSQLDSTPIVKPKNEPKL